MKLRKKLQARLGLAVRLVAAVAVVVLGMARTPTAYADPVVLKAATTLVYGSSADTYSFTAPSAGTITAQVSSVPWPTALAALSFSMSDSSNLLAAETHPTALAAGVGTNDLQVESYQVGAGTYFGHVLATAGGSLNLGLYSVMFTFAPNAVPLPASAGLLLLALVGFFALRRTVRTSAVEDATLGAAQS